MTPGLAISSNDFGRTSCLRGVGSSDVAPRQESPVALWERNLLDNKYTTFGIELGHRF